MVNNIHVTFPPNFKALRFQGYFYNTVDECLYSLKSGALVPLKLNRTIPRYVPWIKDSHYYQISHKGKKKYIAQYEINRYTYESYIIKVNHYGQ